MTRYGRLWFIALQVHGFGAYGVRSTHWMPPPPLLPTGAPTASTVATHPAYADEGLPSTATGGAATGADGLAAAGRASSTGAGVGGAGFGLDIQESWYEKLGRWEDALDAYERKQVRARGTLCAVRSLLFRVLAADPLLR